MASYRHIEHVWSSLFERQVDTLRTLVAAQKLQFRAVAKHTSVPFMPNCAARRQTDVWQWPLDTLTITHAAQALASTWCADFPAALGSDSL